MQLKGGAGSCRRTMSESGIKSAIIVLNDWLAGSQRPAKKTRKDITTGKAIFAEKKGFLGEFAGYIGAHMLHSSFGVERGRRKRPNRVCTADLGAYGINQWDESPEQRTWGSPTYREIV